MRMIRREQGAINGARFGWMLVAWVAFTAQAQTNAWIKSTSGYWEEPEWSLGMLPGIGQAVQITNPGWKAVAIGVSTVALYPSSLTIGSLALSAPADSMNVLLLNYAGTRVPLDVETDAFVGLNGRIVSLNSGLVVTGNLTLVNGEMDQDSGFTTVGKGLTMDGAYYLTNGLLQADPISVCVSNNAVFVQYGGRVEAGSLSVGTAGAPPLLSDGIYNLYGGVASATNLLIGGGPGSAATFHQEGGTNQTALLRVTAIGAPARYELVGGSLETAETDLLASPYNSVTFQQAGGLHSITGTLTIAGGIRSGYLVYPGTYDLRDGAIVAGAIALGSYGVYTQTNGLVHADRFVLGGDSGFVRLEAVLAGGTIQAGEVDHGSLGVDLLQTGGELQVSGEFAFGGLGPYGSSYARYRLLGGELSASNIDLSADMIVDGGPGRITNPGYFRLRGTPPTGGSLTLSNAVEHLGRFILGSSASLALGGASAKVFFSDSSAESWVPEAQLLILNWNGSVTGGGPDQVVFGNSAAGLNVQQLEQVQFVDAAGFPGTNNARILVSGEVVPTTQPYLRFSRQGGALVLSWTGDYVLESAPDVLGPYEPVIGATSPYAPSTTASAMAFFRLKQP